MVIRIFATLFILSATAGCSVYDVAAISTDLALNLFTDVNEGKDGGDFDPNNDPHMIWNYETSRCIKVETRKRGLEQSLDTMFERVEEGKEFVVLPNGEKYPVGPHARREDATSGPTRTCMAREAE